MPTAAADIFSFDVAASCCMVEMAAEVFRIYACAAAAAGDEREQEAPRRAPAAAAVTNR